MPEIPSISVVVPCHNAAPWIAGTLRSVFSQDWPKLEVLVVDDGSTDDSVALVQRAFPQVVVLRQRKGGVAAARNAGIMAASGQWVAFVDADDVWLPGKLRAQMDLLAANPAAHMACAGWIVWPSSDPEPAAELLALALQPGEPAAADGPSGWIYPDLLLGCEVWTSTVVMHRDLLQELGGFGLALKIGEDYDLWLRASRVTPILRVKRPMALYRQHPASLTRQPAIMNYEAAVVERAIARWGYASPDGRTARPSDVRKSLARTWRAFATASLAAGRRDDGLRAAHNALQNDWRDLGAWKLTLKALAQSLRRAP
jgi:GT2 family glycosyltransferase